MPLSRFSVRCNNAGFLQDNQVLGNAGRLRTDCRNNVAPRGGRMVRQVAQDLVACPVAEGGNSSLDLR